MRSISNRLICLIGFCCLYWSTFAQSALQTQLGSNINYIVAKDGSGQYTTLQAAVNAVPDNSTTRKIIFVKKGTYTEKVEIPSAKSNLCIIGEDAGTTIIAYGDYSGSGKIYNGIITSANGTAIGTSTSHSMLVAANDFMMMNITIRNTAGDVGQAVALNSTGDRQFFFHCRLIGFQDTYYTWTSGRIYMKDTYIEGATDYIFGGGVAFFDSCQLHSVKAGSYITAAATSQNFKFGYVFNNCKLTAPSGITNVYLGRPWKPYCQTVFMNSELGASINKAGWSAWSGNTNHETAFYAEYKNCGDGFVPANRPGWTKQLTSAQAATYSRTNLFDKSVNPSPYNASWNPTPDTDPVYNAVKKNTSRFITSACFSSVTCTASISSSGAITFCQGGSVTLTASSGTSYTWKKGSTQVGTSPTYKAVESGSYTVTVTNSSGCVSSSSAIDIIVNTPGIWYADSDGDGKGDPNTTQSSCTQPTGYVTDKTDLCPNDANKTEPGQCGCGVLETACLDCQGVKNGSAKLDACGRCILGTTGKIACAFAGEAEADACSYDGVTETKNTGYSGASYLNVNNQIGSFITFRIMSDKAGIATISFRYANGGGTDRPAQVILNDIALVGNLSFPSTGAFTTWKAVDLQLNLQEGINTLALVSATVDGLANIDQIGYVSGGVSNGGCVVTGINDGLLKEKIKVYPNPTSSNIYIQKQGIFEYQIIDVFGKIMEEGIASEKASVGDHLCSGLYFLAVKDKNGEELIKIVKR